MARMTDHQSTSLSDLYKDIHIAKTSKFTDINVSNHIETDHYSDSYIVHTHSKDSHQQKTTVNSVSLKRFIDYDKIYIRRVMNTNVDVRKLLWDFNTYFKKYKASTEKTSEENSVSIDYLEHRTCHLFSPMCVVDSTVESIGQLSLEENLSKYIHMIIKTPLTMVNYCIDLRLDQYFENMKCTEECSEILLIQYMYQITTALNWLHSKEIIHQDIRCRNIFLRKQLDKQMLIARLAIG